ncbi:MAG: hypothetical protein JJT95_05715 [Pararhodobacter sp.]|nr:hypothetical protein [Pararhodobacter sp.]
MIHLLLASIVLLALALALGRTGRRRGDDDDDDDFPGGPRRLRIRVRDNPKGPK